MNCVVIRALTYFTSKVSDLSQLKNEIETGMVLLDEIEKHLRENKYSVFTKRISFPGLPRDIALRVVEYQGRDLLFSIGYSDISKDDIIELVSHGVYVPVLHAEDPNIKNAYEYSRLIHELADFDPLAATRLSIGFHDMDFQTPYFPDSSSRGFRSIGLAFLYPQCIIDAIKRDIDLSTAIKEIFKELNKLAEFIKKTFNLDVLIDYSLSPWMDNSVARVYEEQGYSVIGTGGIYYTWILNKYIETYSNKSMRTGFNEVMLPYAEDNVLIDYGRRGMLRARDFLMYASTCVAGVDMIVVPWDIDKLAMIIAGAMAIRIVKNKPISLRAIPVPRSEGETIDLGRFGLVTVIPY
ncbi:MAG: DUF711 family protein [Desulfurococcaceae archaeon]